MEYLVKPASIDDLPIICQLFNEAISFQKGNKYIGWETYDIDFIKKDIIQKRLYKISFQNSTICIFSVCYSDPLIWRHMENNDAVYLHRIVLNRSFKGEKIFRVVLDWAIRQTEEMKLKYVRMDTWAGNDKIIDYYKTYGFRYIENYTTENTLALPVQHRNLNVALLQLTV